MQGVSAEQMKNFVIAYEPVWAINSRKLNPTGEIRTATPVEAEEMHVFIRKWLVATYGEEIGSQVPLQYGGSMKPSNCVELLKINSALPVKSSSIHDVLHVALTPSKFKMVVARPGTFFS